MTVPVVVFSYERPDGLSNALSHWRALAPSAELIVVDDHSSSPSMVQILKDASETGIRIWRTPTKRAGRLGGLYQNMEYAFRKLRSENHRFALFSQDDMQIIRPVGSEEFEHLTAVLSNRPDLAQIDLRFDYAIRDPLPESRGWEMDAENRLLLKPKGERFAHFAAVGLFHLERLEAEGWTFRDSELENDAQAKDLGLRRASAADPAVMPTPWPSVRRKGRIGAAVSLIDPIVGAGTNPYRTMTPEEVAALRSRTPITIPTGEVWLNTVNPRVKRPFHYLGSHVWLVQQMQRVGLWRKPAKRRRDACTEVGQ
jgi:hypothetical protein